MGEIAWGTSNNFLLVAIPVLRPAGRDPAALGHGRAHVQCAGAMGALAAGRPHAFQTLPACAMFAATSGSSVGGPRRRSARSLWARVEKRGYFRASVFSARSPPAARLGILIPPSINMIVYGVLTDTSIPKLYLAGFIPGVVLAGLFSLTVLLICIIPAEIRRHADEEPVGPQRIAAFTPISCRR